MVFLPLALFWSFAIWGLVSRRPVIIYLFFASMPFGAFAVVPPEALGGLTFTPTPIVALLICVRMFMTPRALSYVITSAIEERRLLYLFAFWVVAVFATMFLPRVFAGEVGVIPMRGLLSQPAPLMPSTQNMSQLTYLTISVLAVVAFSRLLQGAEMRQHVLRALCLGAFLTIVTGLLDFATQFVPLEPVLAPFRTASYALLTDVEVLGAKRVVGLMPEASSYGSVCIAMLTALWFLRRAIRDERLRNRRAPLLCGGLLLFGWLSTSSATYVGLALFICMVVMEWAWRAGALKRGAYRRRGLAVEFWLAFAGFGALTAIVAFHPAVLDPMVAMIDRMVLQKTSSSSFEERGMWTAVSWQATLDTWGLGVGVGSTRASNFAVAVLSNTGFAGGLCYALFLLRTFTRRAHPDDFEGAAMISGIRWAYPPGFVLVLLVGTSADFGPMVAFQYGLITAIALAGERRRAQDRARARPPAAPRPVPA
ncbi:hypothetical protein FDP22_22950 (plasmid) [Paroceanicella profunda]|uniref:O-antigen ligase family protein n=1 Tax=Paroceanicella profunda TaxID=2579971 RepID=A0A5B8G6K3_9RHOB|nr:hypothetical protein [Paroceanicella profunda]QDL94733.1 hypothetical protein FDP22_22950 [Paroceanicella profunda]